MNKEFVDNNGEMNICKSEKTRSQTKTTNSNTTLIKVNSSNQSKLIFK
jgi:hypothetical protein